MTDRYLTDESWALIENLVPGKPGDTGCAGRDNRLFVDAVLWIMREKAPWRDLPPQFGKWYTTYTRYRRWNKNQVWPRLFDALRQDPSCEFVLIDGEILWRPAQASRAANAKEDEPRAAA